MKKVPGIMSSMEKLCIKMPPFLEIEAPPVREIFPDMSRNFCRAQLYAEERYADKLYSP